jgi:copper chaperone CopZ
MRSKNHLPHILLLFILFNSISYTVHAQFVSATLGINGLTCSLCSYNVEHELKKIEGIDSVKMDLNTNIAKIIFNKSIPIQMIEVVNAVYKAGFSVGYSQALLLIDKIVLDSTNAFNYQGNNYQLLNSNKMTLEGPVIIKFVDKKFVTSKEFKHWDKVFKSENISSSSNLTVYRIIL